MQSPGSFRQLGAELRADSYTKLSFAVSLLGGSAFSTFLNYPPFRDLHFLPFFGTEVSIYIRLYRPTIISEINLILGISGWRIIFWSRIHFYFFNLMHPCLAISKRSQGSKEADLNHSTNRRRLLTNQKQLFSHMDLLCPTGAEQSCDWIAGLLLVNET